MAVPVAGLSASLLSLHTTKTHRSSPQTLLAPPTSTPRLCPPRRAGVQVTAPACVAPRPGGEVWGPAPDPLWLPSAPSWWLPGAGQHAQGLLCAPAWAAPKLTTAGLGSRQLRFEASSAGAGGAAWT